MRTAIIYTSKHGTTEKVAQRIAEGLRASGEAVLIDLKKDKHPSLEGFDTVVLGTSIHMGNPAKAMQRYVTETEHKNALEARRVGLFVCCMHPDKAQCDLQFEHAFPEYLQRHAVAAIIAGGEFLTDRMTRIERAIIRKVAGSAAPVCNIDAAAIDGFIAKMKV